MPQTPSELNQQFQNTAAIKRLQQSVGFLSSKIGLQKEKIEQAQLRITKLQEKMELLKTSLIDVNVSPILIDLPNHLRLTHRWLTTLEPTTATQISKNTKRCRAVESHYLNQLCVMGVAERERRGRKAFFKLTTK